MSDELRRAARAGVKAHRTYSEGKVTLAADAFDDLLEAALAESERLERAELVCLMMSWTGSDNTERGKALHELWSEWLDVYSADGGTIDPADHPELSDARIRELAERRDATVARTLSRIRDAGINRGGLPGGSPTDD